MNTLEQGQQALETLYPQRGNRYYPHFHLAPRAGWMNDPNGLVFFNGRYHAFYQHHPFSVEWGPMHWGHAISDDMLRWYHQPIALAPDSEADRDGCFSGCAVVDNGRLALIYTGHRWLGEVGDDSQICEVQCLATSQDGITFTKQGVIVEPPAGIMHFRDPKVWFEAGSWWMVVGARDHQQRGQVLLYRGESLTDWTFDRILAQAEPGEGYMWECPDFFSLGDHHYLLCSPQGIAAQGDRFVNLFQSGVIAGHWSAGNSFTKQQSFKELDHGHDFYAPQSFVAAEGRRILIAWMDMWESAMPTKAEGWCGCFTLPRELTEEEGQLRQRPIRELQSLRDQGRDWPPQRLTGEKVLLASVDAAEFRIDWDLRETSDTTFGLQLGQGLTLCYNLVDQRLSLNRDYSAAGLVDSRHLDIGSAAAMHWQIYVDRSSIEIFINDGEAVFSSRIYPTEGDRQVKLFSTAGDVEITALHYWPLRSAIE